LISIIESAQIILKNEQFIADCWIFSKVKGVKFSENFENYLPGVHVIDISFEEQPKKDDFDVMYR
jgi:hypothetical protein